jgi:hypothetical protein
VVAGVIHKPSHVQGSRNKLVHVCNKGGTEGRGYGLISVRVAVTKKGTRFHPQLYDVMLGVAS